MQIDLTQVIVALIGLLSIIVTSCIVPYLKSKLTVSQYESLRGWTKIAVEAAEKMFVESGMGEAKKKYVKSFLNEKGFDLNDTEIDVVIESAVLEMQRAISA